MFNFLLETAPDNSWVGTVVMMVLLLLVFWLFMIRPQKKQEQRDNEMRNSLAIGDEVTTIGGIIGKVVSIKGETFVLETTRDKTKIRFLKGAIRTIDVKAEDIAAAVIAEEKAQNEAQEAEVVEEVTEVNEENN